ncbi:MAG TPA: hypothetical protein VHO06_18155, partial [Polyangia bacterium]|nr:hypothetical protein [Polyangia bacterium]
MRRRDLFRLVLGGMTGLVSVRRAGAAAGARFLYLQPLGDDLPAADVELVRRGLTALLGIATRLLPRVPLPPAAYYPPRRRYRAEKLLDFLDGRLPPDGARILGLTGVDISTTKGRVFDWGLLGLGRIGGASSVISELRCRMRSSGPANARERL